MHSATPFKPVDERYDSAPLHPGEFLREDVLPHFSLTRIAAARLLNMEPSALDDVLDERASITAELAAALQAAFGLSATVWQGLQIQHDLWQAAVAIRTPGEARDIDANVLSLL